MLFLRRGATTGPREGATFLERKEGIEGDGLDPLEALSRYRNKKPRDSDEAWLQSAIDTWLKAEGSLSLDRCFGVTYAGWCRFQRDEALRKAARLIDADGCTTGAQRLKAEWDRFISRGAWSAWRDDGQPPPDASLLGQALFWATRYNRSDSLTVRQIERIVRHIFTEKCR